MTAKFPLAEVRRNLSGVLQVVAGTPHPERGSRTRFEMEVSPAIPVERRVPEDGAFRRLTVRSAVVTPHRVTNVDGVFDLNEQQALALARELLGRTYRIERVDPAEARPG